MAEVLGYAILAVIAIFATVIALDPMIGFLQERVETWRKNRQMDRLARDVRYREQMRQYNQMRKWSGK